MPYQKETENGEKVQSFGISTSATPPVPSFKHLSWKDYVLGSHNPKWRTHVRLHLNASTNMSARKFKIKSTPGFLYGERWMRSNPNSKSIIWMVGCPYNAEPLTFTALSVPQGGAVNAAAGQWYSKVRNAMSTFKGSVFAAEARDAQRMMWTRATKMLSMIDPYQNRVKKRWYGKGSKRARLKQLSDSWLELQFGWLPLASDIQDAVKVLNEPTPQFKRVFAFSAHTGALAPSELKVSIGVGEGQGTFKETTQYYVKYYGEVEARRQPTGDKLLDFGLGVREFLPTLWEVIPWSFAVDYFTNVSSIVNAVSYASTGCTRTSRVIRSTRTRSAYMTFNCLAPNATFDSKTFASVAASWEAEATAVDRAAQVEVPIPSLTWKLPDWKQSLNLAALAVSRRLRLFNI